MSAPGEPEASALLSRSFYGVRFLDAVLVVVFGVLAWMLVPDVALGPFGALNPQRLCRIVWAVLTIGVVADLGARVLGARGGALATGLVGGFVSSTATIGAMGLLARREPDATRRALATASASNVATVVEYGVIVAMVNPELLARIALPFGAALVLAAGVAWIAARGTPEHLADEPRSAGSRVPGALLVGAGSALVAIVSEWLSRRIGPVGVVVVSALSGLVDAHATAGSVATLHHDTAISSRDAMVALLAAFSTNALTKCVIAVTTGTSSFSRAVVLSVLAMVGAAWIVRLLT